MINFDTLATYLKQHPELTQPQTQELQTYVMSIIFSDAKNVQKIEKTELIIQFENEASRRLT